LPFLPPPPPPCRAGSRLTSRHFASAAGRAMGMAVGPEAPFPNGTPLMKVPSTSEKLQ
jgi:hypothetical protein